MTEKKRVFREGDIVQMDDFGVCFHLDSEECIANCGQINPIDNPLVGLSLARIKEMFEVMLKNIEQEHRYFLEMGEWKDKQDKALFFDHLQITLREVERMKKEVFEGVE